MQTVWFVCIHSQLSNSVAASLVICEAESFGDANMVFINSFSTGLNPPDCYVLLEVGWIECESMTPISLVFNVTMKPGSLFLLCKLTSCM